MPVLSVVEILYTETSVKLKRKSKMSWENAVTACKVYGLYISDILQKVDEVMKLFGMEKELRIIKKRGHFPVPQITPQGTKNQEQQRQGQNSRGSRCSRKMGGGPIILGDCTRYSNWERLKSMASMCKFNTT